MSNSSAGARTVAVPKRSCSLTCPPSRSAARRATGRASPSTTTSRSTASRPSRRSRTAPPTRCTPCSSPSARSSGPAHGRARRRSSSSAWVGSSTAPLAYVAMPDAPTGRPRRRRLWFLLGALAVLLLLAGGGIAYLTGNEEGDVVNTDVPFTEETPAPAPPPEEPHGRGEPAFFWP